ncbi:LLM class flavin-dependent oxidoreductase [Streptosporangium sp. NPDC000396]|uniref:LLM class flavin-dependent oxidoreductase n=1 Tax=Streptosporangium sp. NPDC000396 TaxID=3366185 RepID=UPI0036D1920E
MFHGLSLLPDCAPATKGPDDYFRDVLLLSRLADQGGMSHVKMTEHYLGAYGGYCPSPLAFLAAVATVTSRIRLMTGCLLPVFHHPVQLASETAMVDAVSGGRLDVGFARAYLPQEFAAFQVPLDGSRERFTTTVQTVLRLWTEEGLSVDTPFFGFRDVTTLPRPVQRPHPPVWIAAVRSRSSFAWIGEQGYNLLVTPALTPLAEMSDHIAVYREAHADAGHPHPPRVAASLPLYVGDTDEEACRIADPLLRAYLEVWAAAADSWGSAVSGDYRGYTGMSRAIRALDPVSFRTMGSAVVGAPATVAERIEEISEALGADGFLWQMDFGAVPGEVAVAGLERFLDKVLPALPAGRS